MIYKEKKGFLYIIILTHKKKQITDDYPLLCTT
jgi:hypothetical protein